MSAKKKASKKARKRGGAARTHPSKPKVKSVKPRPQPRQKKTIIVQPLGVRTPLDGFFSRYPKFLFQPSESPVVEFNRLCKTYNWKENNRKKNAAREAFQIAMKKEFDNLYGSDEKDIKNWQKLCYVLRIDPVPDTLWTCRAEVLKKHVNLVDLVHGSKEEVRIFQTEEELSKYTKETKKFFPKEDAVDGGVLRALRRHILAPREGTSSSMSKGPGRYLELK